MLTRTNVNNYLKLELLNKIFKKIDKKVPLKEMESILTWKDPVEYFINV